MLDPVIYHQYCEIQDSDIVLTSCASSDVNEVLAYVRRSGDLSLIVHVVGQDTPSIRWIPWFDKTDKRIAAIGFEPSGNGLYVICHDQSAYLVPALALVNIEEDRKEITTSVDDIISLPSPFNRDDEFTPSAFGWWVRQSIGDKTRHIGIVGSTEGQLVGFIIQTGTVLFSVTISHAISSIELITKPDSSQAIITAKSGKQWRLTLIDSTNQGVKKIEDALGKVFSSLNINNVEDKGDPKQKAPSKAATIFKIDAHSEQRVHCKKDAKLDVILHAIGDQNALKVFCNSVVSSCDGNVVAVQKSSSDQLFLHRLPDKSRLVAMTRSFFFITFLNYPQAAYLISRNLSLIGNDPTRTSIFNCEFNTESLAGKLGSPKGCLMTIFASTSHEHLIIMMEQSVHFMRLSSIPEHMVLMAICENDDLQEAEEISKMYGVDLQQLILEAATQKLSAGEFDDAYRLFSYAPGCVVNQLLTLTIRGCFRRVLDSLPESEPMQTDSILLNNLKVMLFAHETLKNIDDEVLVKRFRRHLASEKYDEIHAVRVLTQNQLMTEVHYLVKKRGLQQYLVAVLMSLSPSLDMNLIPGFWDVFSDSSLTESLLSRQAFAMYHIRLLKKYIFSFDVKLLSRLERVYNPYQGTVRNFFANFCKGELPMQEWLETYLLVCIHLSAQLQEFDVKTLGKMSYGHIWEVDQPKVPCTAQALDGGYKHSFVVMNGIAYGWGETTKGCLGSGPTTQSVSGPKAVESLLNLKKCVLAISCGGLHTIALTNDGVYTWGDNRYGQLGSPGMAQSCYPVRLDKLSDYQITAISAGQYHSLAVDDNHRVFSWGFNVHGQLGHATIEDVASPKIVIALSKMSVYSVSAGHSHSLFLDLRGRVWACGNNAFGQLGMGEMKKSTTPVVVYEITRHVSMINAGSFQNLALTADGRLYQWGRSPTLLKSVAHSARRRALLEGPSGEHSYHDESVEHMVPRLVDTSQVEGIIRKVVVGNEHCALLTSVGTVYTWGRNIDGQLGILSAATERRSQNLTIPTMVDFNCFLMDISCGWQTTLAFDRNHKIWTWGVSHHLKGPRSARHAAGYSGPISLNNKSRFMKTPSHHPNIRPVPTILNVVHHPKEQALWLRVKLPSPLIQSNWKIRMHYALETLMDYYEPRTLLEECENTDEYDAHSKLAFLSRNYSDSAIQQLHLASNDDERKLALDFYISLDIESEALKKFLLEVINFWKSQKLNFFYLENILMKHQQKILGPIISIATRDENVMQPFSTFFRVHMTSAYEHSSDFNLIECNPESELSVDEVVQAIEGAEEFMDISHEQLTEGRSTGQERRFFSM